MQQVDLKQNSDLVIVGAGIIGLACAYYLTKEGLKVTIIDQGKVGAACSYGNCGYICPSHLLPLTEPGMVWEGIKSLLNPKSAFRIKPQLRPSFYYWLMQFSRRCNQKDMMAGATALDSILQLSRTEYSNWMSDESLDAQWKENGLLYVFESEKGLSEFKHTDQLLTEHFSQGAEYLSSEELQKFDSVYKENLTGAYFYRNDASVKPDLLTATLADNLREQGVTIIENCKVESVLKQGNKIQAIKTNQGSIFGKDFVFATGAWSRKLGNELGISLPVEPGKGYSVTIERPENSPSTPVLFPEHRVGLTPFNNQLRLGSMMEFVGFNNQIPQHRIQQLFDSAKPYMKESFKENYELSWTGWRPMTWDSLPIIGSSKRLSNLVLATGHNMLGITLAPATGKLVAQIVTGKQTEIPIDSYSPDRF